MLNINGVFVHTSYMCLCERDASLWGAVKLKETSVSILSILNKKKLETNLFYISVFSLQSNQIYFYLFIMRTDQTQLYALTKNSTVLGPKYISAWKLRFGYLMGIRLNFKSILKLQATKGRRNDPRPSL